MRKTTAIQMGCAAELRVALLHLLNAVSIGDRLETAHKSRRRSLKLKLAEELTAMARTLENVVKE